MNITFFGSCSREWANRGSVSFLVEDNDSNLLIDCGPGLISGMKKSNKKASDINNLLLTHVHGDHISSIGYFVWYRKIDSDGKDINKKLNIYGQKDTLEIAKFNIEHMYPSRNFIENVNFIEVNPLSSFECGSLKIKIVNAIHAVPCIGCTIESSDGKKLAYSSDTLPNEEMIPYFQDADLLIHEGMLMNSKEELAKRVKHSTAMWAGEIAKATNAKALALVHIEPDVFGKEKELIEEARKLYNGLITIPVEGTVYNI